MLRTLAAVLCKYDKFFPQGNKLVASSTHRMDLFTPVTKIHHKTNLPEIQQLDSGNILMNFSCFSRDCMRLLNKAQHQSHLGEPFFKHT
jgi:hypothetical protein